MNPLVVFEFLANRFSEKLIEHSIIRVKVAAHISEVLEPSLISGGHGF